jgi:hypothetical protein
MTGGEKGAVLCSSTPFDGSRADVKSQEAFPLRASFRSARRRIPRTKLRSFQLNGYDQALPLWTDSMVVMEPCKGIRCAAAGAVFTLRRPRLFFVCLATGGSTDSSSLRCVSTVMTLSPTVKTCTMSEASLEVWDDRSVGMCSGSGRIVAECAGECSDMDPFGLDRWWFRRCSFSSFREPSGGLGGLELSAVSVEILREDSVQDNRFSLKSAIFSTWKTVILETGLWMTIVDKTISPRERIGISEL